MALFTQADSPPPPPTGTARCKDNESFTDLSKIRRFGADETPREPQPPPELRPSLRDGFSGRGLGEILLAIETFGGLADSLGCTNPGRDRPVVCVQGLGFVGVAMAIAVADARDRQGEACFNVVGVELATPDGQEKAEAVNAGRMPMANSDTRLHAALERAVLEGNLVATTDASVYGLAAVTLVDIHLDVDSSGDRPSVDFAGLRSAVRSLGDAMPPGSLVIVETTVPPGTCAHVVAPELESALTERGLPADSILLAHAYERVMPGRQYLDSIINFWRVYAGHTPEAADACEAFLSQVINVEEFPLTRLMSTTASETAKVLENSYRATNIAFMEEWGRFGEAVGIDLFEIVEAIRVRPTHSNIRQPGFGVGGYCLTKDPHLADVGARELFGIDDLDFPFSQAAVRINQAMPSVSVNQLEELLGGRLDQKQVLLLGVSYRNEVGDTRYGPSEIFVRETEARGAQVSCHDPLVAYWPEMNRPLPGEIPSGKGFDAVVFAVAHEAYTELDLARWLDGATPLIFDANAVLSLVQRQELRSLGCELASIGRGRNCE